LKLIFSILICLVLILELNSQEIKNIRFEQDGKMINIYYDLLGDGDYEVRIYFSSNGITWNGPLKYVSGDVDRNQKQGVNKKIVWDVLSEWPILQGNVSFKITAYYLFPEENEGVPDSVYYYMPVKDGLSSDFDDSVIFIASETMPEFPGGEDSLYSFLAKNIIYPQAAKEAGIKGRVFATFVVERDGTITDIRILRGIGGGCDEEVIRVVQTMPHWIPGKQKGKTVRVQYNLPVKFTLQ